MGSGTSKKRKSKSHLSFKKNCKECELSKKYGHCCYNSCFDTIFNADLFVDVLDTNWIFSKKHEIELYNILLPIKLESIIPIIGYYLGSNMNIKKENNLKTPTLSPIITSKKRSLSVPFYVPDIDISSCSYNTSSSSNVSVHAYFHGYISLYNNNFNKPPCLIWIKSLPFDQYDHRKYGRKKKINITVLGDVGVGKSTLIHRYLSNEFNDNYSPTIADSYTNTILLCKDDDDFDDKYDFDINKIEQEILDTAGGDVIGMAESIDEWIENGQIFLLCFDVTRGLTLKYLKSYILPRIQQHFDQRINKKTRKSHIGPCALILVGCKVDLRQEISKRKTSNDIEYDKISMNKEIRKNYNEAMQLSFDINIPYIETSSKTSKNVNFLFRQSLYELWIQTQTNCIKWIK